MASEHHSTAPEDRILGGSRGALQRLVRRATHEESRGREILETSPVIGPILGSHLSL